MRRFNQNQVLIQTLKKNEGEETMKRFQKALFTLAAVVALGWIGASTASAQVTFFVSASSARQVRFEGFTEATGVVAFSANSGGTIVVGTTITLDYGTGVSASPSIPACSGSTGGALAASVAITCTGNVVTLTFTASPVVAVGQSLTISGTRVNANALGAGANINVAVSAVVPAASQAANPVTLVVFTALTVATVQAAPSTLVTLTPVGGINILFCQLPPVGPPTLVVTVVEKFAAAFLSLADENGLGIAGDGGGASDFKLRMTFTNVPIGVKITPTSTAGSSGAPLVIAALPGGITGSTALEQEAEFDITLTATSPTTIETVAITFTFTVPDITDAAFPKVEGTANLRIVLRGASDPPDAPVFSTASSSRQFDGAAHRTLACASYLLFPWVAYTGDGAVDTGLAIANTTADPPQIGTIAQKGDVTLHFWRSAGGTNPPPLKIATALEAGRTTTYVVSQLGSPFTGYVIAVCTFQMGHGLAAFLSGGAFNGYIAMVITNPRLVLPGITEATGH
jgi:hypothetical protein